MNVVHEGIVLKNYIPIKQKISILDSNLGRIEGIFNGIKSNQRLFDGAYISYTVKPLGLYFVIENTNILSSPLDLTNQNFIFFHHVLELSYYFLPLDNQANDIFKLINIFYLNSSLVDSELSKNIFLCKFFTILGIFPSDYLLNNIKFYKIILGPIDIALNLEDSQGFNIFAKKWLSECINSHPMVKRLRTLDFLNKLDLYE